jgi:hypothetical protein
MKNTFSSEIGYRLLSTTDIDIDLQEKVIELLISEKPIELIVHHIKILLKDCLTETHPNILIEKLTAMLNGDPSLHDTTQLKQAIVGDSWPSVNIDPTKIPAWKNPSLPKYRHNPNVVAMQINKDIDQVRISHQIVFQTVIELADYLDRYSAFVNEETSNLAIRLVNLGSLFAEKYDVPSLAKLIIAFDKITPHIDESFAFFAQDSLYKQLSEKTKDGIAGNDLLRVLEALSFTAGAYIVKHRSESAEFYSDHLSIEDEDREDEESADTKELVDYCLEQLLNSPDIFNGKNATRILKCLCDLQCSGFNINHGIAAKLTPENLPRTHSEALIVTRSGYIFDGALSKKQRKNLLAIETELKRCFDENERAKISVSDSERDAQEYLRQNYDHLPLQFNTWVYGFERDCFVDFEYGLKIDFEIDGYEFHRFKVRKDAMMNYISEKKGIKVVRIEKIRGFQTKSESIQDTYQTIDSYLHHFKKDNEV